MRKAKGIDELYDEVKECDIVITNDAPLATALNSRVCKASIGSFAYTPRQIAGKEAVKVLGKGTIGDLKIISAIADETGFDFKYIHGELENIRTIRRYRANPDNYLYSRAAKEVYRSFNALPTIEKVMSSFDPSKSEFYKGRKRIGVIGLDLFDDLDKHFIPMDFIEIDLFKKGDYDIDTIYQIGNDRQIADNIVERIDSDIAEDTAIVLDTEGAVADAIRAALYRRGLPFKNTMAVRDLSQIRDFLQFVTLSLNYDTIRIRHVREIFSNYGGYLRSKQDEYLLSKSLQSIKNDKAIKLAEIMRDVRSMTFGEVMESIVHPLQRPQIKILLEDLMMVDKKVTSRLVSQITYAVNNVTDLHHNEQIPEDEKRGVLLVNCNNSVYVDRPFVIFVGIGPEWSPSIIGKEYIDRETEFERDLTKFSVLIQQGNSRLYAVNYLRGGKPSRPCSIFEQIYSDREIEGFEDVCKERSGLIKGPWHIVKEKKFSDKGEEHLEHIPVYDWKFSKSTYNLFRQCPRAYMFGELMRTPDSEYTVFGSIIHEFAELYVCYPEMVKKKGIDHYLELIQDRYSGISCGQMESIDRTEMRVSMLNVMRYLNRTICEVPDLDRRNSNRKYPNELMAMEGCDMYSRITETEFRSQKNPIFGNFDLILGDTITDYKTGKATDIKGIRDKMIAPQDHPEFQPMIYLALLYQSSGRLPCRFNQFYVKDKLRDSIEKKDFDVMQNIRTIEFIDMTFEEYMHSSDCSIRYDFNSKTYEAFLIAWSSFIDTLFAYGWNERDNWGKNERLKASVLDAIGLKPNKTNIGNVEKAIRKILKGTLGMMFCNGNVLIIPRDTMESFLIKLDSDHSDASRMIVSNFPGSPSKDCSKCNFLKVCTVRIDDDGDEGEEDG